MAEIEIDTNQEFVKERDIKYECEFTDMRVSNIGYGKDEYKSSKPNIVKNDALLSEIIKICEAAETAIGHTIGPYADETLIQSYADDEVPIFNTRDGYTILQKMRFTQPIPNAIFKIIREISEYLQEKVGDSTSSGIPIETSLIRNFVEIFNKSKEGTEGWKFSPVGIRNISQICVAKIIEGFFNNPKYQKEFPKLKDGESYTKEQEDEIIKWLTKVATISANNDKETGKTVAELFRDKLDGRGNVYAIESRNEEEYVEETKAYIINKGLTDHKRMSNRIDGITCEYKNPLIAMFDGPLLENDLPAFKQIVETAAFVLKRPLIVMAHSFDISIAKYVINALSGQEYNELGQHLNDPKVDPTSNPKKIEVVTIIVQNKEILEQYSFDDTVLMLNATPFSTELTTLTKLPKEQEECGKILLNLCGSCESASMGYQESLFYGCKPNKERYDARIKELMEKIENLKKLKFHYTNYNQDDIMQRIASLECKTTFFYCGGRTDKVKRSRKLVVEDAISACAAAIKNGGISIGGNMAICHYIEHNFDNLVHKIMDVIESSSINITAAENKDDVEDIVRTILEAIRDSFGQAYRYALYNMYRDSHKAFDKWSECVSQTIPSIYNIMTNSIERFDCNDVDKCTTIIVPRNTDVCLLTVVIETVCELINMGNMITIVSPGMDLEALQLKQMETGAIYAAQNSIMKVGR